MIVSLIGSTKKEKELIVNVGVDENKHAKDIEVGVVNGIIKSWPIA